MINLFRAAQNSINGLKYALLHERPFQLEALVFILLLFTRNIPLICGWTLTMCLELINSAVERAFDLIDKNYRAEIKAAKDMLSAAVFISILLNLVLLVH